MGVVRDDFAVIDKCGCRDDGIGVEEITLTIHRECASGKSLDTLSVSDVLPPARSHNGAVSLPRPRQARRLSETAENERTEN